MSARKPAMTLVRRPSRAVPVTLLAVVLLAAGGAGVWLLATHLLEDAWPAAASGAVAAVAETPLQDPVVQATAVALAVAGVLLLLAAIVPGRPSRVRVLDDDVAGETVLSRRDLARRVQQRAENVDGVHSALVAVRRNRIDATVRTVVDETAPVASAASMVVERAVEELRPDLSGRPRVRVQRRS